MNLNRSVMEVTLEMLMTYFGSSEVILSLGHNSFLLRTLTFKNFIDHSQTTRYWKKHNRDTLRSV